MKKLTLSILILFACNYVKAQAVDSINRVGIVIDQDYFLTLFRLPGNQDRNYTMGAALPILQFPKWGKGWAFAPHRFLSKTFLGKRFGRYGTVSASAMLANTTFTPAYLGNLHDPASEYKKSNDRPFASLNFIGTSLGISDSTGNKLLTIGINIGAIGLGVSKAVQTTIHKDHWFGNTADIPEGWENQISDGGEPTLLITAKKEWLLLGKIEDDISDKSLFQVSHFAEARVGYYVNASYGLNARFGLLDKRNWGFNTLPLSSGMELTESQRKNVGEIYLLGGLKGNIWLYNGLIVGQFRHNPYELKFNQLKTFTIDWNVGIGAKLPFCACNNHALRASLMVVGRSPEFNTIKEFSRWHSWGSIQLYYEW